LDVFVVLFSRDAVGEINKGTNTKLRKKSERKKK
jgi:hypothetical protein